MEKMPLNRDRNIICHSLHLHRILQLIKVALQLKMQTFEAERYLDY